MRNLRFACCALLLVLLVGCGGRDPGVKVTPPSPPSMAKAALEEMAAKGQLISSVETLRQQLEAMKDSDPAKANELLADYDRLISLSKPSAIKKKAEEMAGKL